MRNPIGRCVSGFARSVLTFTPGPAEATKASGMDAVAKNYMGERMTWDNKNGFTLIAGDNGSDDSREQMFSGPTQTRISQFKIELQGESARNPKLAAFLLFNPELMTDDRSFRFNAMSLRPDPLPFPPRFPVDYPARTEDRTRK